MSDHAWAYSQNRIIRPRDVHDGPAWGVTYEAGEFGSRREWLDTCELHGLNSSWFRVDSSGYTPVGAAVVNLEEELASHTISATDFSHEVASRYCETQAEPCLPDWGYETCTPNEVGLDTPLEYFLNKLGVHNSSCLQEKRKQAFAFIHEFMQHDNCKIEELNDLCNGEYDPRC
jgi:hypothetical protein